MAVPDTLRTDPGAPFAPQPTQGGPTPPYDGSQPPGKGHGWIWALVILTIIAGVVAYRVWSRPKQGAAAAAGRTTAAGQAISVGVVPVAQRDVPYYVSGLGTVTPYYTVTVHSRVDGQIMAVHFREGQFVHAGDLLAEIDPRPYEVALAQAQGQLAKDTATQANAQVNLSRDQSLWKSGVIAKQELDSQTATVGQFEGSIQTDKAQIDSAKLQLAYCHITAPISGRVGLRLVDPGNIVHASDQNGMLVIAQLHPIAVIFTLPEDALPEVQAEMKKRQLTVEAYSRDGGTKLANGKLETVDNQIDPTTGTIKLKAVFDNPDSALWPNQFVNARLFLTVRKKALVIPTAAVQKGANSPFVYIVDRQQEAQLRPVDVDFNEGNLTVIRKGLAPGEEIVVDGQDKLQQGTKVSTHPSTAAPSSANAAPSAATGYAP
ncbi:MAG TPA: MdtA/MuxA family multidrug efflux RND transporter periplasmic adaptor subunit [Candidatus Acidoferrales bacterium]|nr:MdtA/MuxA family multidrug efflux RND transporter periplasmic adaptor subunit [Candidatus Acidoferrales bacterium]